MKSFIKLFVVVTLISTETLFGAAIKSADPVKVARKAFESEHLKFFNKRVALPSEVIDDAYRFDRAPGSANWRFLLRVAADNRVRFIKAKFADGKFVEGELFTFGLKSEALSAADFDNIVSGWSMAAIAEGASKDAPVAIYRKRGALLERMVTDVDRRHFVFSPIAEVWGAFPSLLKDRGMIVSRISCDAVYCPKDGGAPGLLFAANNRTKQRTPSDGGIFAALKKIREANGGVDIERINNRDLMEWYVGGKIVFKPVLRKSK